MDTQSNIDKIIADLDARELYIASFICADKDGKLQVLSYDNDGLITFLSEKVNNVTINERLEGRMIRPVADIGIKKSQED